MNLHSPKNSKQINHKFNQHHNRDSIIAQVKRHYSASISNKIKTDRKPGTLKPIYNRNWDQTLQRVPRTGIDLNIRGKSNESNRVKSIVLPNGKFKIDYKGILEGRTITTALPYPINTINRLSPINGLLQAKLNRPPKRQFKDYSFQLDMNQRESMEDLHLIVDMFNKNPNQSLFCLFDGHGGKSVAEYAKDQLPRKLSKIINYENIEYSLRLLFSSLDESIMTNSCLDSSSQGSTCTVCFLYGLENERILYLANVGDSRALLIKRNSFVRISYDHKPSDEQEKKRIQSLGGVVFSNRLFGQFGLSRALGDSQLKKYVSSEPYISKSLIRSNDLFIVIASDGIWDVISDKESYEISKSCPSSSDLCKALINTAKERWSRDNLSVIVIRLNDI